LIPFPVPPLKGLSILVTRPAAQAVTLCSRIEAQEGIAIRFPTIAIEALSVTASVTTSVTAETNYDWLIFTSVHAVEHGLQFVNCATTAKIAAIGKATAAALVARKLTVHATPEGDANSESLLAHAEFAQLESTHMLIVRGVGGRELLQEELAKRKATTEILEVYRRNKVAIDSETVRRLEEQWADTGIDIVTLTSAEVLENLISMLSPKGQALLSRTPFVAASERVARAADACGLRGACILSRGADDDSLLGSIANWHTRAHV
jgi:uroporphyrinogen-III synthase